MPPCQRSARSSLRDEARARLLEHGFGALDESAEVVEP
jgi:hypothetical protein